MKSSFTRKGAGTSQDTGTRPGLYGLTLVSSGCAGLDELLGGGLPCGSLTVVREDSGGAARHHQTLLKYFLAEGVACSQAVFWGAAAFPGGSPAKALPQQLAAGTRQPQEASGSGRAGGDDVPLRIAWQYERYARPPPAAASSAQSASSADSGRKAQPRSSSSRGAGGLRQWCHDFDLTRHMGAEALAAADLTAQQYGSCDGSGAVPCSTGCSTGCTDGTAAPGSDGDVAGRLAADVEAFVARLNPGQLGAGQAGSPPAAAPVGRVGVLSLGCPGWGAGWGGQAQVPLMRALYRIKAAVRGTRCAAMVTVPTALAGDSYDVRVAHIADCVLRIEAVADDSDVLALLQDPGSCVGLLSAPKLPSLHTLAPASPAYPLYVLRNRRRRLAVEPLEIDPDKEFAAEGSSGGDVRGNGAPSKSVAAAVCGGPPGGRQALDF